MKAVVYHKPKDMRVENVDDPKIEDARDAIVRVTSTAICGSDLHFYNGTFPQFRPMVMGHEFMGIVDDVGSGVNNLKKGDRVVVPFPISCGVCWFCQHQLPTHCENSNPKHYGPEGALLDQKGAGLFGYSDLYGGYNGGQAEAVRVPYADYGPRKIPDDMPDDKVLFVTDILSTGWTAVEWADLTGGETVAVFGCGPVGLMTQKSAWLHNAGRVIAVDVEPYRLAMAKQVANVETINALEQNPVDVIRVMTDGRGADVCIDAVGMEAHIGTLRKLESAVHVEGGTIEAFAMCVSAVRRGGTIPVVGVYGTSYDNFPWGQLFDKGILIKAGQAPVHNYIDNLLDLIKEDKIVTNDIITHTLPLDQAPYGYKIFNDKQDNCVKVVMNP
ncbi:MAG: zinc-dependent alcohol dehydrogenase [Armatimonadota bacterium]